MHVAETTRDLQYEFLRALYELAGGQPKKPVFYGDISAEFGKPPEEIEQACDFWAARGVLDWVTLGHVALTHVGARRAERLASRGWSSASF